MPTLLPKMVSILPHTRGHTTDCLTLSIMQGTVLFLTPYTSSLVNTFLASDEVIKSTVKFVLLAIP